MVSEDYEFCRKGLLGKKFFSEAGRAINFYNLYFIVNPSANPKGWLIKTPQNISILHNNVCSWYLVSKNGEEFDEGLEKALKGNLFKKIKMRVKKSRTKIVTKLKEVNYEKISDKMLAKLVLDYYKTYAGFCQLPAGCRVVDRGIRRVMDEETIRVVSVPKELTYAAREHLQLLKLASEVKANKLNKNVITIRLNSILKKYCYFGCGYFNEPPRTFAEYESILEKHVNDNPIVEYNAFLAKFNSDLEERNRLLSKLDPNERKIAVLASEIVALKDYSKVSYGEIIFHAIKLFEEISKRTNKSSFFLKQLLPWEIVNLLLKKENFGGEILKRANKSVMFGNSKKTVILIGNEVDLLKKKFFSVSLKKNLNGRVASKGIAAGKVCVVLSPKDFRKMKKGNILVVKNTNPDYLFLMKLAGAIVAEEGGLTSHVSVTSRELGVPCIVGIEDVTKILKDGAYVEVDANKGIIKSIKN